MRTNSSGQVIIGAIILLVLLAILVPGIIVYVQNESKWTVKEQRTTRAFQLAEAAVERGFQHVIQTTATWASVQAGAAITHYNFDRVYVDAAGEYAIRITSGPGTNAATVTGVGRDLSTNEVRSVRVVYGNSASNAAIYAEGGISLTSNPGVEWGPVMSPASIVTTQAHPRFYSAGSISKDPNGATPPNSDNIQWWSYYPNLPPPPQIDLQAYLSSATAQGHVYAGGTYDMRNDICGGSATCSGVYYFTGNTTLKTPSAYVNSGAIVVIGNLTLQGSAGGGSPTATIPTNAWKEYGADWAYYRTNYDASAPASFPGVNGSYPHGTLTKAINNVLVHGFLYVNDALSISGGGNMSIWGSLYLGDQSSLSGSHVKVYYDDTLTVLTKNISLLRSSWGEVGGCTWAGAFPTCPN